MTNEQRAVLAMVVLDPDAWMKNAVDVFGEEKATKILIEKVEKYRPQYDEAIASGTYKSKEQTEKEYKNSPKYLAQQEARAETVKLNALKSQAITENLPSWTNVEKEVDNIGSLDDAKAFLKKLARIVYWDVKGRED
jgi:hypothetical protein